MKFGVDQQKTNESLSALQIAIKAHGIFNAISLSDLTLGAS